MSQPDFNPFDPISAAMGAMHGQNLMAAKDARIKQLEDEVERLRKAGDGMQVALLRLTSGTPNWNGKVYWAWNAAKDGNANG